MNLSIFFGHVFRFWRIPNRVIDRINPLCLPVTVATPAVVGSLTSFWIVGMMGLCLVRTISGAMAITMRKPAWAIAALFAAWCLLHIVFGLAHSRSRETILEIIEVLPFLGVLPLYAGLALTPPQRLVRITENIIIAGAIVSSLLAGYQILGGWVRAEGMVGNPGPFGLIGLLLYGYCLVAVVRAFGNRQMIAGIGVAAAFGCVLLSGMRGLWPGLLILPIAIAFIYRSKLAEKSSRRGVAVALAPLAAVMFATFWQFEDRVGLLVAELGSLDDTLDMTRSTDQHIAIWSAGIELFIRAPFAGHGLETSSLMAMETLRLFGESFARSHFHNALIDIGVKSGITGILVLIAMFAVPLVLTARHRASGPGRFGFAMMCVLMISYAVSGISGIMLDHDILDTVFIFSTTYWAMFAFEAESEHE